MTDKQPEILFDSKLKCPYCGHAHSNEYEYFSAGSMNDETEIECAKCEKTFRAFRHVNVDYSMYGKEVQS